MITIGIVLLIIGAAVLAFAYLVHPPRAPLAKLGWFVAGLGVVLILLGLLLPALYLRDDHPDYDSAGLYPDHYVEAPAWLI